MRDYTGVEVKTLPGSIRVVKRSIPVPITFARESGELETIEGRVRYAWGDALATGVHGERWPIRRDIFLRTYSAIPPTMPGEDGCYSKKPLPVWAARLAEKARISIAGGELAGKPGDWLVQYGKDEYGIVAADIFSETYAPETCEACQP